MSILNLFSRIPSEEELYQTADGYMTPDEIADFYNISSSDMKRFPSELSNVEDFIDSHRND